MAGRIQGITVEIGGDTTKLQTLSRCFSYSDAIETSWFLLLFMQIASE